MGIAQGTGKASGKGYNEMNTADTREESSESNKNKGCGLGCMLAVGVMLGAGLILTAGLIVCLASGKAFKSDAEFGSDEYPNLQETWSSGQGDTKVVRIPLRGMITLNGDSAWNTANAVTALRSIRRATRDEEVEGIILDIDSGGGGITASDILYNALREFKNEKKGRVVVTLMGDVAASGAYYIALASDYIIAHPTTITGSIGVILQSYNIKELAQKIGVRDVTIKSGANKDILNPFRDVDPAQKELLQSILSQMYDRFLKLVVENRKLAKEKVAPLADGRVFSAQDALANKLIDAIGYGADAQKKIASLLDVDEVSVYRYSEPSSLLDLFGEPPIGFSSGLRRLLGEASDSPRLFYRWNP